MTTAYDSAGIAVQSGDQLTGLDGAAYEFIEVASAPTATAFGKVRMRKLYAGPAGILGGLAPRNSSQLFADIAFDLAIR